MICLEDLIREKHFASSNLSQWWHGIDHWFRAIQLPPLVLNESHQNCSLRTLDINNGKMRTLGRLYYPADSENERLCHVGY